MLDLTNFDDRATLNEILCGMTVDDAEDYLRKEFGMADIYDEKIANAGDEEGTYVMERGFDVNGHDVILAYLDTDEIVADVEVR